MEGQLEIKVGNKHLALTHRDICSLRNMEKSVGLEGSGRFYCLVQNLKILALSRIILYFKVKPIL